MEPKNKVLNNLGDEFARLSLLCYTHSEVMLRGKEKPHGKYTAQSEFEWQMETCRTIYKLLENLHEPPRPGQIMLDDAAVEE